MEEILITGGAGFIGSHLCKLLIMDKCDVLCVDNYFTGPINLGNLEEITILDLAQQIINLTGSSSRLVYKNLPDGDPRRRKPDIALARQRLEWEPRVVIKEVLQKK